VLAQQNVATQAAKNRIEDADYALETSKKVKAQILQQGRMPYSKCQTSRQKIFFLCCGVKQIIYLPTEVLLKIAIIFRQYSIKYRALNLHYDIKTKTGTTLSGFSNLMN